MLPNKLRDKLRDFSHQFCEFVNNSSSLNEVQCKIQDCALFHEQVTTLHFVFF